MDQVSDFSFHVVAVGSDAQGEEKRSSGDGVVFPGSQRRSLDSEKPLVQVVREGSPNQENHTHGGAAGEGLVMESHDRCWSAVLEGEAQGVCGGRCGRAENTDLRRIWMPQFSYLWGSGRHR